MAIIETKLRDIGNSKGVLLPKEVLDKMNIGSDDKLFLVPTRDGYELRSSDPDFQKQMDIAAKGMKKYRNALRALAE